MASPATPMEPLADPPTEKKRKKQHGFSGSKKKFRQNLAKAAAKHRERTGQTVAHTLSALNTARAIEKGGLAVAEKCLGAAVERKNEAEKKLAESEKSAAESRVQSESNVNLALDLARETEAALQQERARRIEAEEGRKRAEREERRAADRAAAKQQAMEERNRAMKEELRSLKSQKKKLEAVNLQVCRASGIAANPETQPEEGSIRGLEDQLQLEKFRVSRLESRMRYIDAGMKDLKEEVNSEKKKVCLRAAVSIRSSFNVRVLFVCLAVKL